MLKLCGVELVFHPSPRLDSSSDSSTLVYIRLQSSSGLSAFVYDQPTLVYTRLVTFQCFQNISANELINLLRQEVVKVRIHRFLRSPYGCAQLFLKQERTKTFANKVGKKRCLRLCKTSIVSVARRRRDIKTMLCLPAPLQKILIQ